MLPYPVIVLPGIQGTELVDFYPVDPEPVWTLWRSSAPWMQHAPSIERAVLHPDDLRFERTEPARLLPTELFNLIYGELVAELRKELSPDEDQPVPVYPFAYDWRMPLAATVLQLEAFVEEVVERTMLMRHYHPWYAKAPKVNLVGHSMGGMIIAGYLQKQADDAARAGTGAAGSTFKGLRTHKVATLGTPFLGSFEAPLKVTTGKSGLSLTGGEARLREMARLTPALYHLLPSFGNLFSEKPDDYPEDFFTVKAWQPSIVKTMADFIQRWGLYPNKAKAQAPLLLQTMLNQGKDFSNMLKAFSMKNAGLQQEDWLSIIGVDDETRLAMRIKKDEAGEFYFDIRSEDRMNLFQSADVEDRVRTGDGTVPYLGARAPFIDVERVVCVSKKTDIRYYELRDEALARASELHIVLPCMDLVHRLLVLHFTGKQDKYGSLKAWPAPDLPAGKAWNPPVKGLVPRAIEP